MTLWITGLHEILGRNYGIEEPLLGPWGHSFSDMTSEMYEELLVAY